MDLLIEMSKSLTTTSLTVPTKIIIPYRVFILVGGRVFSGGAMGRF
jgi:hypothetical protein